MVIKIYPDNKSIKITRDIFERGAADIESLIHNIADAPRKPDGFEMIVDSAKDISSGLFDGQLYAVDFIFNGEKNTVTINEDNVNRFNRGLPVLLVSC